MKRTWRWATSRWWVGVVFIGVAAVMTALLFTVAPTHATVSSLGKPSTEINGVWLWPGLGIIVTMGVIGILMLLLWDQRRNVSDATRRQRRIATLTTTLQEALGTIESIRKEMLEGQKLLDKLEEDTKQNKVLSALTKEQSEAVRYELEAALDTRRRWSRWFQIGALVFSNAFTVVVTWYFARR